MDAAETAKYLRFLAELLEKDATRVHEMRSLSFDDLILFAMQEANQNISDAEDLKKLGNQ